MIIEYKGLKYNIINNLEENNIYIFSNKNDKKEIEYIEKNKFLNYKLMSETEFWDKFILTNKYILKEEKETIFFYNSLTQNQKKFFNINGYFDCIDIAYNYYNFMKEYLEYKVNLDNIDIYPWQKDTIKIYLEIHSQMMLLAEKENKIPRYLIHKFSYLNYDLINSYKKIIFIDKFSFTEVEKEYLSNLKNVEIHLSVLKEDYNEENNYLKKITVDKLKNNIKIIEVNDKLSQIISMIDNKNDFNTFYDNEENKDNKIKIENIFLNQKYFFNNNTFSLELTENYNILSRLNEILKNEKNKDYQISDIYKLYSIDLFKKIFKIDEYDFKILNKEALNFRYINSDKLNSLKFIDNILNYSTKEDFLEILTKIFSLTDEKDNCFDINYYFYEALTEVNTIDFSFLKDFPKEYLNLLVKYLKAKKISLEVKEIDDDAIKVKNVSSLSSLNKNNLALINFQVDVKLKNTKFFTRKQREILKLPIHEKEIYNKWHIYYKNIVNADNVYISYIKDEHNNISEIPFLTNLIFEQGINVEKFEFSINDRLNLYKKMYSYPDKKISEIYLKDEDKLFKSDSRFEIEKISVSEFLNLELSEINYYLSKKIKDIDILNDDISERVKGNIIHKIIENLFNNYGKDIFNISKEEMFENINDKKYILNNIILNKYKDFFWHQFLDEFKNNFFQFIKKLKEVVEIEKIIRISSEKSMDLNLKINEEKDIKLIGTCDLFIETYDKNIIIDFKSGKENFKHEKQIQIYANMEEINKDKENIYILSYILDKDMYFTVVDNQNEIDIEYIKNKIKDYLYNNLEYRIDGKGEDNKTIKYFKYEKILKGVKNDK